MDQPSIEQEQRNSQTVMWSPREECLHSRCVVHIILGAFDLIPLLFLRNGIRFRVPCGDGRFLHDFLFFMPFRFFDIMRL